MDPCVTTSSIFVVVKCSDFMPFFVVSRQFDLRTPESASGTSPNNVLVNLNAHIGPHAEAKCLAINPVRPEQMAVGANDPYVRLYDRRMLTCRSIKFPNENHGAR